MSSRVRVYITSNAERTPPYAEDMPGCQWERSRTRHTSVNNDDRSVAPVHDTFEIRRMSLWAQLCNDICAMGGTTPATHPNDPLGSGFLLQLLCPATHDLLILHLRETSPPVRPAAVVQRRFSRCGVLRQARVWVGWVRRGEGRGDRLAQERATEVVDCGRVRGEVREGRSERAVGEGQFGRVGIRAQGDQGCGRVTAINKNESSEGKRKNPLGEPFPSQPTFRRQIILPLCRGPEPLDIAFRDVPPVRQPVHHLVVT